MAAALVAVSGTPNGKSANERLTATPGLGAKAGPALTPTTDVTMEASGVRSAEAFAAGVPAFNMEVEVDALHPQSSRAQHYEQVSQASSSVAAMDASPPAAADLQWQPVVALVPLADLGVPSIKAHGRLMFASGAGEAVASGRGVSTALCVKGLVLHCGMAILELCAEQRSELRRPGGELDKVEMLGWLLGDLLSGALVSHEQAMAIGTKAGKMVFGKTASLTSKKSGSLGSLTKLDNRASARLSKLAADDPRRAEVANEEAATRAAHLLEPVTLPVPQAPKSRKRREPLLSELLPPASATATLVAPVTAAPVTTAAPAAALAANPAAAATTEATTEATSVSLDAAEQEHVVAAQAHVQAEAVAAVASVQVQVARAALSVAQQEQEDGHNNIARLEAQLSNVQIQMDESDAQLAAEKAAIRERVAEWERMQAAVVGELNELTPALAACMSVPACTLAVAYMSRRQKELVAHLQWIQSEAGQMAWMGL